MFKPVAMGVLSLCILLVSWLNHATNEHRQIRLSSQVRESVVQRQQAEHRLKRINDGLASPLLDVLGEDISTLQVRIAEYFTSFKSESEEDKPIYKQSLLSQSLSTESAENMTDPSIALVHILRLDLQVKLAHAQEYLGMLRRFEQRVGGWPVEVRACDLQKLPMRKLRIRCVLDIFHWPMDGSDK